MFTGDEKKNSLTSSIAFDHVYDTRQLPHRTGRSTYETDSPS